MEQANQNVVGDQIRRLRARKGLTQQALSTRCIRLRCDLARGTVAKIEAGIRRVNDMELLVIARVLRVDMIDLFPRPVVRRVFGRGN